MATLSSLLIKVGVSLDGSLRVEERLRGLRTRAQETASVFGRMGKTIGAFASDIGKSFKENFQGADISVAGLTLRLGGVPGALVAVGQAAVNAAKSVFTFVTEQTAAVAAMEDTARATGLGTEEFQRLRFAAIQTGASQEQFAQGMKKLNATLLDLRKGGTQGREALDRLGVSFLALEGKSRTEQLGILGDALGKIEDPAERSALAAELFGMKAGPQLAALLAEGTEGINALAASAEGVLSDEDIARAAEFDDQMEATKATINALTQGIAIELLPMVQDLVLQFQDWIRENDELIRQDVAAIVEAIGTAVGFLGEQAKGTITLLDLLGSALDKISIDSDKSGASFDALGVVLSGLFGQFTVVTDAVNLLSESLVVLDAVSGKVGKGLASGAIMNDVRQAVGRLRAQTPAPPKAFVPFGPTDPGAGRRSTRKAGGGGGGKEPTGREGGIDISKAIHKFLTGGEPTLEEAASALLSGQPTTMSQRLKQIASSAQSTKDVKPVVAMDVYITNWMQGAIQIDISGSGDPSSVASEAARVFEQRWKRHMGQAGQALGNPVVR